MEIFPCEMALIMLSILINSLNKAISHYFTPCAPFHKNDSKLDMLEGAARVGVVLKVRGKGDSEIL